MYQFLYNTQIFYSTIILHFNQNLNTGNIISLQSIAKNISKYCVFIKIKQLILSKTNSLLIEKILIQLFYYCLKQIDLGSTYCFSKTNNITIVNTNIENLKEMSAKWLIT